MLIDQATHRAKRVAMESMQKLTWGLSLSQADATGLICGQPGLTDLLQQVVLTFCQEQDLILSEVPQLTGGFAATDAALMAAQLAKQGLQLQVIGWQARDVITMQQIRAARPPQTVPSTVKSSLGMVALEVRVKRCQECLQLPFDLSTGQSGSRPIGC